MDCPECGSAVVAFEVPEQFRELLPGDEAGVGVCTHCLTLRPVADPPTGQPDCQRISDAFPTNPDAAVPMALAVGLLDRFALYRSEIATLFDAVERAGTDPMLVVDRLAADPTVDSHVDLDGRRRQLEQLL
ncbi:Uncharacterized protein HSBGL_1831 [Halapricum desulfuricans]|uniref:Small CPxCG-related zinc finger protein n=1 Tax=Halapricum desulfuricans TaxID=2841257 RepID=A0A897NHN3_9EURY|nr:DUF6276 family protein [Halapricum desulfuricans]QSG12242.1 Uncharacterized protein HSBGL_1831 [Halapricum desulfuricans]